MQLYGSTPIGYMVAFSMPRPIALLAFHCKSCSKMHGLLQLDNPRHACRITGFLPLHIAVVNGLTGMYDFILNFANIRELEEFRSRPNLISTRVGQFREYAGLTPLQLAAKVGDHRLFQYIMRRTAKVLWVWGPVTQYELSLDQIDSTGETGNDVMELIGMGDAQKKTQEMLLDNFMQGFLHKLFEMKWRRYGRHLYTCYRFFDLIHMGCLSSLILTLKNTRRYDYPPEAQTYLALLSTLPVIIEDARAAYLYYRNIRDRMFDPPGMSLIKEATDDREKDERGSSSSLGALADKLSTEALHHFEDAAEEIRDFKTLVFKLYRWCVMHQYQTKIFGFIGCWIFCIMLLAGIPDGWWDYLWLLSGISLFCFVQYLLGQLFAPFPDLGVLWLTTLEMATNDVVQFLILFGAPPPSSPSVSLPEAPLPP